MPRFLGAVTLLAASLVAGFVLLLATLPAWAEVQADPRPITWKNCAGTITTGGTAQTLSVGTQQPRGFTLQNPSTATESLYFEPNGTASAATSLELVPGNTLPFGPGTIFSGTSPQVVAATAGHAFKCYYGS